MLKPLQFFIFIALGGTSQRLSKNVPSSRQQTEVTETSFLSIFFKMLVYITVVSILAIGKHIDMEVNISRETENTFYICIKFVERRPKDG